MSQLRRFNEYSLVNILAYCKCNPKGRTKIMNKYKQTNKHSKRYFFQLH